MVIEDREIIQEFLVESQENLARLDQEMVELELHPENKDVLASVFRTIHTIKGTCGFLGFGRLEKLAHITEDILNELRQERRRLDGPLTSLILASVDAVKRFLHAIETDWSEGEVFEGELIAQLERALTGDAAPPIKVEESAGAARVKASGVTDTALRVDVRLLDRLMNLVGELVLTRNQLLQYNTGHEDACLNTISQRFNLITSELQEGVMKTRMQPIGLVWNKLPRIVRDLARSLGKEVDLEMEGARTELDRAIIDAIKDPLTHIVRNSCDHGIEAPETRRGRGKPARGRLYLRAYHEGGQVNIEISDDGGGIDVERVKAKAVERELITKAQAARLSDREAINLVFLPGFSMAAQVTNVSGRGVGMNVVKTHIERIGGTVELQSRLGQGTTVRVRIPLTLAIIPGLVVGSGGERFIIPQVNLHELIRLDGDPAQAVEHVHSTPVLRRRNALLRVADLNEILGLASRRPADETCIAVLQTEGKRFGLIVDEIGDSEEIVVKPMGQQLKNLECYAGATIMGDGRIALILDVAGLGLQAGLLAPPGEESSRAAPDAQGSKSTGHSEERRNAFLLCRAGSFERLAIPLAQVARLEKIAASAVEHASGCPAVQYRKRILLLLNVAEVLGTCAAGTETLDVVVYRSGDSELGLVVDEILDVVDETIGKFQASGRAGLLGSAVIGGRMTDFLDVESLARSALPYSPEGLGRLQDVLQAAQSDEVRA